MLFLWYKKNNEVNGGIIMSNEEKKVPEKTPNKKELDAQIIKSVAAILCTAAVAFSSLSSTEKICDAKIAAAKASAGISPKSDKSSDSAGDEADADYRGSDIQSYDEGSTNYSGSDSDTSASVTDSSSSTASSGSSQAAGKAAEKYTGPLLFKGVIPFDFSKADPDPSKWTVEQIVACYKSGMAKEDHDGVQTDQLFQLVGDLPGATSALKSPINLAMKIGAQPYGALTGGYWDLQASDLKKATARKEGDYVIINLYPKEQVDGAKGKEHEGTVGHVCNVVQGIDDVISYIEENYAVLNAYYDDDSIILKYPNAYAENVKINTKTGKMESGTWGYDVEVYLDHCGLLGIEFNDFHTTIRWKCWYPVVD